MTRSPVPERASAAPFDAPLDACAGRPLPRRRRLLRQAAGTLLGLAAASLGAPALAQDARPIEWVVGYAAGGGSDAVARTVAERMAQALGRSIVVNNKPGAATNIAADYVAKSRDVGAVMLTADFATLAANPALFARLSYNAERDLAPVGLLARFPMLLVVPAELPVKDWRGFQAWAKAQAGGVNYASAGPGSPHHLGTELLRERSGLNLLHVPYRGAAPAVQDLIGGRVPVALMDSASVLPHLQSGKLRAIGVASARRLKILPELPTLAEQGLKDFEAYAWQGLAVPAATPAATVQQLHQALQTALDDTRVKARFQVLGLETLPGTPQQMADYAKAERERWGRLITANGIRLD
ncbi:Bug family tripartite tricarboxylate transporter substrate binding protein [Pseudaquabacterium rugosum]|uniref:Tripartite tricarboxylate transporter substrate-binding protein n=1 Tax=Pseudaquabacterium rugosum TaxID=2984194 RepID=A0ABU9BCG2_9BURK